MSDIFVIESPDRMLVTSLDDIRDRFRASHGSAQRLAKWCADHPDYPDLCRYCGKRWRKWTGSRLDGHAKCIVGSDFKAWLREAMRDPQLTYAAVASACGLTPAVVRSWTYPIRGGG